MVTRRIEDGHMLERFSEFEWQRDRDVVPDWLNAAKGTESYPRVEKLIDEIRQVAAGEEKAVREGWYIPSAQRRQSAAVTDHFRKMARGHSCIQELLSRYFLSPVLLRVVASRCWKLSMFSRPAPDEYVYQRVVDEKRTRGTTYQEVHFEQSVGEADVVFRVLNLAAASELERLKQCENCWKWFYAERSHQRFCPGGECRLSEYSKSPKYKNYRKLYMRRKRAEEAAELSVKPRRGKGR